MDVLRNLHRMTLQGYSARQTQLLTDICYAMAPLACSAATAGPAHSHAIMTSFPCCQSMMPALCYPAAGPRTLCLKPDTGKLCTLAGCKGLVAVASAEAACQSSQTPPFKRQALYMAHVAGKSMASSQQAPSAPATGSSNVCSDVTGQPTPIGHIACPLHLTAAPCQGLLQQ